MGQKLEDKRGDYIIKAMKDLSMSGDSYHSFHDVKLQSMKRNHVSTTVYNDDFDYLVQQNLLLQEGDRVYLMEVFQYEVFIAKCISEMMIANSNGCLRYLPTLMDVNGMQLTNEQRSAVMLALNHPLSMILGGAGTGKTTLIDAIVQQLRGTRGCGLCAPTGKAARNLSERNNRSASTVYSMLRMTPENHMLSAPPLEDVDLIIVDEASMLTLKELAGILEAAGPCCKLVLIGDPNQLLSVGSGNIVPDLLELGAANITLSTYHRQAGEERALLYNVRSFNRCHEAGDLMLDDSFAFVSMTSSQMILHHLATEGAIHYRRGESVQVIAPTNSMVYSLNCRMQQLLNPVKHGDNGEVLELEIKDKHKRLMKLRDGDRVMMLRNNYTQNYCNGDTGVLRITSVTDGDLAYRVEFPDGRECIWNHKSGLQDITLAYAITVHKSQGSEYDTVLMPMTETRMNNRNLIYTAISRAKKKVLMVGDMDALDAGLKSRPVLRRSALVERIRQTMQQEPSITLVQQQVS